MSNAAKRLKEWHQTKPGLLIFGVTELAITYGFISLSIDRGNLWWYLLSLIFLTQAFKHLGKLIGNLIHGSVKTS